MTRSTLPQNFLSSRILNTCDSLTGWSVGGDAGATLSINASLLPDQSCIEFSNVTATLPGKYITRAVTFVPGDFNEIEYSVYVFPDSGAGQIQLGAGQNNSWSTNMGQKAFGFTAGSGWNVFRLRARDWAQYGTPPWDAMRYFRFYVFAAAGQTVHAALGPCRSIRSIPRVILSFDDGSTSQYTTAFPYMVARGIKGSVYVPSEYITNPGAHSGALTETQLTDMYNAGWLIGNHATNHQDLSTYTDADELSAVIAPAQAYIAARWPRGANFGASPFGTVSDLLYSVLTILGFKSWRTGVFLKDLVHLSPPIFPVWTRTASQTTTWATAKSWLDYAIATQSCVSIVMHTIDDSGGASAISPALFRQIIDYIYANRMQSLTLDEYFYGLSDPRYSSIPPTRTAAIGRSPAIRSSA